RPHPITNYIYDFPNPPRPPINPDTVVCTRCSKTGHGWAHCPQNESCTVPGCHRQFGHYGRRCPLLLQNDIVAVQSAHAAQVRFSVCPPPPARQHFCNGVRQWESSNSLIPPNYAFNGYHQSDIPQQFSPFFPTPPIIEPGSSPFQNYHPPRKR